MSFVSSFLEDKRLAMGAGAILIAAFFWSLDGLFIRPAFYSLPAELVVFWEHFLGFIVLIPFLFISWSKIKVLTLKSWLALGWVSLFGGLLGTFMITQAFFSALAGDTSFATVIVLQKLQPFFALILARLILKEKLSTAFYLWTVLAITASYFLAFGASGLNWQDINWLHNAAWYAFLAAFAFGSSTVFGKRIANHLDYRAVAALRFGLTSILAFLFVIISGSLGATLSISGTQFSLLGLIVLTSGAGAMFLYYFGLQRVSASVATILELFWPLSALFLDYFINGNQLTLVQLMSAAVLLLAFFQVSSLSRKRAIVFRGKVIPGAGRGRRIGYRTANLDCVDLDIPHGIYVVKARVAGREYPALMHFGFRDVYQEPVSLEILIKNFSDDIYNQEMEVEVQKRIREVKNFPDTSSLVKAIEKDLSEISDASVMSKNNL